MLKKRIIGVSVIFLILIVSLCAVSAANETAADESPSDEYKTFESLQNQIDEAGMNDTLKLSGHYISEGSPVNITKSLTIEGDGNTVLDGNETSRMMNIIYFDVTLKNLKFINGNGKAQGGAILSTGKLTLINCTFINNKVTPVEVISTYEDEPSVNMSIGGAICCENIIDATDCTFTGNTAYTCAALYYVDSLTCTNCSFTENKETSALGLIFVDMETSATFNNCSFKDNVASGAIIYCDDGKLRSTDTVFSNNKNAAILLNDADNVVINGKKYTGDVVLSDSMKKMYLIKATANALTTTYNSGDKLKIKVVDIYTKKPVAYYLLKVRVYTGSSSKVYEIETNEKGMAGLKASTLSAGTHKIEITSYSDVNDMDIAKVTTKVKVAKATTTIKAPKVTNKYKKAQYFKVTLKSNKKAVKNVKVKVKVYTGKKTKTYTIKTDSKGVAKLSTKSLKYGKHKVVISSGNSNYKMSASSTITIKW